MLTVTLTASVEGCATDLGTAKRSPLKIALSFRVHRFRWLEPGYRNRVAWCSCCRLWVKPAHSLQNIAVSQGISDGLSMKNV